MRFLRRDSVTLNAENEYSTIVLKEFRCDAALCAFLMPQHKLIFDLCKRIGCWMLYELCGDSHFSINVTE